jgi:hypothetical protein
VQINEAELSEWDEGTAERRKYEESVGQVYGRGMLREERGR